MKIERIATAVLFTMVAGAEAASRERVLPVIEIHASVHQVVKSEEPNRHAIADSVCTSVMALVNAIGKPHAMNAHGVPPTHAYAADLQWVNAEK